MNGGRLIVFEGLDGCGKSTQLARAAEALRARGHAVLGTREPSDGPHGRRIRAMARSGERVAPEQELAWFWDDRREHVREVLRPALDAGRVVLCDRYFLSTVAYQGAAGLDWRRLLTRSEAEFPLPDLALLFELPVADGLARSRLRSGADEPVFEDAIRLERAASIFRAIDRSYLTQIDASGSPEQVAARVLRALDVSLNALEAPCPTDRSTPMR